MLGCGELRLSQRGDEVAYQEGILISVEAGEREERRMAAARCHDWQAWARGPTGQPWTPAGRESEAPNYADGTELDDGGREDAAHARTAVVWRRPRSTPR
jgi:hypothetical protein